eukprot:TRINITY_DN9527_c0_g1_i1.p1 TRINITY_DN9527_c0_g1~~TRINITY_DN9527_c0_g1_i1.p1  ORF type:complete len:294 (+),score=67.98 TRINITY_DN9527_c0_g1_i1:43-924(+)
MLQKLFSFWRPNHFPANSRKVFFVTGCASGIGMALAKRLLELNQRVLVSDLDFDRLVKVVQEWGYERSACLAKQLDVTKPDEWQKVFDAAVQHFGHVDVLMNVAGFIGPDYVYNLNPRDVNITLDVNTKGPIFGTHVAANYFRSAGIKGHIINICSLAGLTLLPGNSVYAASKAALRIFTNTAAIELARDEISTTLICPDAVNTPMLDKQVPLDAASLTFSGSTNVLTPDDIVNLIITQALPYRPRELWIPYHRGVLARLGELLPWLTSTMFGFMVQKGHQQQLAIRETKKKE